MAGATSLKDYLKRYQSTNEEDDKKKKKKKKKSNVKPDALGVLVVDEDPVWQKPLKLEEEEDDDSPDEEKPVVNEDIEVKRMKRLEMLRAMRPFGAIAEDGSGWSSIPPKDGNSAEMNSDMSPPRRQRARNDTPSPEREGRSVPTGGGDADLSPPRQPQRRHHTPSPEPNTKVQGFAEPDGDLSPPRQRRKHHYSPSPEPNTKPKYGGNSDLSPPRRRRVQNDTDSSQQSKPSKGDTDLSPPRQRRHHYSPSPEPGADLSPPRKSVKDKGRPIEHDFATQLLHRRSNEVGISRVSADPDLSPPRKNRKESSNLGDLKEQRKTGLLSGREIQEEIDKTKKESLLRFRQMDPSVSGRGAEPVYRDKKTGERISKDEFMKSKQKIEEKPKEKKLEWGKGLAQKREAEARLQELEITKDEPFARTRDDPKLDEMLKERLRWGDPMAHLVKKKHSGPVLADLGDNEKMKESGFIIPQDIPSHSWIRRGLDAAPNRYGIKPGRHWDGVDRSTGFEKQLFKRKNDKQATEMEAYLWSVSDM